MALDTTTTSPATDVKSVHPQPAVAGTDAAQDQKTRKVDAPLGGGLGAATLAEVRKVASAVEKPIASDLNTLVFTPLVHVESAMSAAVKSVDNSVDVVKASFSNISGDNGNVTDSKSSSTSTSKDAAAAATPDPNANKSIYTRIGETVVEALGVPAAVVNAGEYVFGLAWDSVGNYATDLLKDNNLQQSMVSTGKDGQVQIDQQKAQQVIDMQAIKNVFQGDSGIQHVAQVDRMFSEASFHNPDFDKQTGDASTETAAYKTLDAQRTQMLATGHKPGDSWSDNNGVYSIDKAGNLLEVTGTADNRDIKWIGQNGQSYEKDPSGNET